MCGLGFYIRAYLVMPLKPEAKNCQIVSFYHNIVCENVVVCWLWLNNSWVVRMVKQFLKFYFQSVTRWVTFTTSGTTVSTLFRWNLIFLQHNNSFEKARPLYNYYFHVKRPIFIERVGGNILLDSRSPPMFLCLSSKWWVIDKKPSKLVYRQVNKYRRASLFAVDTSYNFGPRILNSHIKRHILTRNLLF